MLADASSQETLPTALIGLADREIIAKAEGRFAKADKQNAGIKAGPEEEVQRAKEHLRHVKKRPSKKIKRARR